jgi:hypothetical protein
MYCLKAGMLEAEDKLSRGNSFVKRISAATSKLVAGQQLARTGHVSNSKALHVSG